MPAQIVPLETLARFENNVQHADDNFRLEYGLLRSSHRARVEGTSHRPETPCREFLHPGQHCRMIGYGYSAAVCRVLVNVSMSPLKYQPLTSAAR